MLEVKKLTPEGILTFWKDIKEAVRLGLPPTMDNSKEALDYTLGMLVQEKMQMWVGFSDSELKEPAALAITQLVHEPGFEYKNLLIYTLVAFRKVEMEEWLSAFATIKSYAKKEGCRKIIAFTNVQRVVDIVKDAGGSVDYVLVTMEV